MYVLFYVNMYIITAYTDRNLILNLILPFYSKIIFTYKKDENIIKVLINIWNIIYYISNKKRTSRIYHIHTYNTYTRVKVNMPFPEIYVLYVNIMNGLVWNIHTYIQTNIQKKHGTDSKVRLGLWTYFLVTYILYIHNTYNTLLNFWRGWGNEIALPQYV